MDVVAVTGIGVLGALIGSFLNVVIHRVPLGESVVTPRSRCPACSTTLTSVDNVPVVSWLVLRGRCRHCGAPISARYPLVELLAGLLFAAVAALRGVDEDLVRVLPFVAALVALAAIDLEHRLLPNRIVGPLAAWGVAAGALFALDEFPELLIAGAGAFAALLVVALIAPRGMGMGDVKLAGLMGLFLGLEVIPALFAAFVAGSAVGLGLIAAGGPGARKQTVPFGPFLAAGSVLALLAGAEIIDLYRDSFLA